MISVAFAFAKEYSFINKTYIHINIPHIVEIRNISYQDMASLGHTLYHSENHIIML